MKYKKYSYILVLILMLVVGISKTYASTDGTITATTDSKSCYYMSDSGDFKARVTLHWNYDYNEWLWLSILGFGGIPAIWDSSQMLMPSTYTDVVIDKAGEGNYVFDDEWIANWFPAIGTDQCIADDSVCFGYRFSNYTEANSSEPSCPQYLVFQDSSYYWVWATDSESKASQAQDRINANGHIGFYGKQTTADKYFAEYLNEGLIEYDQNGNLTCADYDAIFGSKDDPDSIRYMINSILGYVRVIVPILIILLGTIDFAKAVLAGKEDNMKKAQSDFVKRLIAGVAVFLVPSLIDLIMGFADIVWAGEYFHCPL